MAVHRRGLHMSGREELHDRRIVPVSTLSPALPRPARIRARRGENRAAATPRSSTKLVRTVAMLLPEQARQKLYLASLHHLHPLAASIEPR